MPYEQVTKIKARDGSLHDTVEAARAHDARREWEDRKEQTVERLCDFFDQQVTFWAKLPLEYGRYELPAQNEIAELIVVRFAAITSIIKEGMGE